MELKLFCLIIILERLKNLQSKIKELCIYCDVRNKKSVKKAFNQICERYGGDRYLNFKRRNGN